MKKLLIFFVLLVSVLFVDLRAVDLSESYSDSIRVSIEGEIPYPGTYELEPYATVNQLLEKCGGINADADMSVINRETVLHDNDVIVIPLKTDEASLRVSINQADADTLCTLPGIGKGIAEKIIAWRNENGSFQSLEQLMEVKGIGQAKFDKIRDRISL